MATPRTTDRLLLVGALAAILVPTLIPIEQPAHLEASKWVLSELSSSDLMRNLLLFMPLGAALAQLGYSAARCVALALLLSGGIETLQLWIPGRFVSPLDLLANGLGAALGQAVLRWAPLWLSPTPALSRRLVIAAGGTAAGLLLATGPLLAPAPVPALSDVQWVAAGRGLYPYEGQLLSAELDGQPLPPGPFPAEGPRLEWLSSDYVLALSLRAGPAPAGLSSFLRIWDPEGDEVLLVGPDRSHLVLRYRSAGRRLGLEWAALRWRDALAGVAAGQRIALKIEKTGAEICISIEQSRRCGFGFNYADGWQVLAPAFRYPSLVESALTCFWLAGLVLPLGFWGGRDSATLVAWSLVMGSLLLATQGGDLRPIPLAPLSAAAAAALLGARLRSFANARLAQS